MTSRRGGCRLLATHYTGICTICSPLLYQRAATAVSGVRPQIFFSYIVCCIGGRAR
ncbi:hypothetical protein HanXRQr2_Chr11g0467111 [Helianthus annuus]|uniref:Uncharacterized protein n=1 Tax=Helianthus annuus TaxID=4232 RepID=A0A9K3HKF2_HELAN|nr:hypothetical protein HanXRQr2_Chr11g0467111 [Helianthus annuus]KAJ0957101.1 hypothetical protein HanPSC8_Chr01g0023291 [Helianthus annuus]